MDTSKFKIKVVEGSIKCLTDLSDENYFGDDYKDYVSNSRLKLINPREGGSPSKYLAGLQSEVTDSLLLGTAVHELFLQPEEFEYISHIDRPTAKMGLMADELYKIYKENLQITVDDILLTSSKVNYYKDKMTDKLIDKVMSSCMPYLESRLEFENNSEEFNKTPIFLPYKMGTKMLLCLDSLKGNSKVSELIKPSFLFEEPISLNEITLLVDIEIEYEDKQVLLKLKGKLDNVSIDIEENKVMLNDLKTTGKLLKDFGGSFENYHYARQLGMYMWMLKLHLDKVYPDNSFKFFTNILLVSTIPNHNSGIFTVNNGQVLSGFKEFKELICRVAYCEMFGYDDCLASF